MIINLTHPDPTAEQAAEGVGAPFVGALLTFDGLPTAAEIGQRAIKIADAADAAARAMGSDMVPELDGVRTVPVRAMIGGDPFLMATLESELRTIGIEPIYAFSVRESAEQVQPDGSVRKVNIFRHVGWVSPC